MTVVDGETHEQSGAPAGRRERGRMEQLIESVAGGLGNSVAWMAEHGVLFALFLLLWIAFATGLVWSQGTLHDAWEWVRSLPLVVQVVVWLLFLPVMAGLWVWETSWPLVLRLVVILGIAGWNLLVFLPRALPFARA